MTHTKSSSRDRTRQIALLLLPVVGVIALRVITDIRYPPQLTKAITANSEKVMDKHLAEQKAVVTELKKHLAEATDAVNAGDFAKAKGEYNEFQDKWATIERDFKEKSRSNYEQMEEGMNGVTSSLINAATPDKGGTLARLQQLIRALDAYTSSVFK